jgi:hypothetical protein
VDGHLSIPADGSPSSTSFALPRDVRPPRGELVDFAEDDGSIALANVTGVTSAFSLIQANATIARERSR